MSMEFNLVSNTRILCEVLFFGTNMHIDILEWSKKRYSNSEKGRGR